MTDLAEDPVSNVEVIPNILHQVDPAHGILQESRFHDLVIMRTYRHWSNTGDLNISNLSNRVTQQLDCSLILQSISIENFYTDTR